MAGLFDSIEEQKRQRLYARGWVQRGGTLRGRPLWQRPDDGALVEEEEAFRQLARMEAEEAGKEA